MSTPYMYKYFWFLQIVETNLDKLYNTENKKTKQNHDHGSEWQEVLFFLVKFSQLLIMILIQVSHLIIFKLNICAF